MCTLFANLYVLLTWGPHMVYIGSPYGLYGVTIWSKCGPHMVYMGSPYSLPWGAHIVYHGVPIWFTMRTQYIYLIFI